MNGAIRPAYDDLGADEFYRRNGASYRNPHEETVAALVRRIAVEWPLDLSRVLDLACGSGEVTLALQAMTAADAIDAIDPYTGTAYLERTGRVAEAFTFAEIGAGALAARRWTSVFCSFALHLAETSRLPLLCLRLAEVTSSLVVITPHKRPTIDAAWGWTLVAEIQHNRVRARHYTRLGQTETGAEEG